MFNVFIINIGIKQTLNKQILKNYFNILKSLTQCKEMQLEY